MAFLKIITILSLAKLIYGNWVVFEYHIQNQTMLKDPEKYRIENTGDYPLSFSNVGTHLLNTSQGRDNSQGLVKVENQGLNSSQGLEKKIT